MVEVFNCTARVWASLRSQMLIWPASRQSEGIAPQVVGPGIPLCALADH